VRARARVSVRARGGQTRNHGREEFPPTAPPGDIPPHVSSLRRPGPVSDTPLPSAPSRPDPGHAPQPRGVPVAVAEHSMVVRRTARYATLGRPSAALRELWYVCHGYGQLAGAFIRHFAVLDDGTRLVIAPEALSRFYVAADMSKHAEAPVGATWMTREAREAEIADYVAYLDALHARISEEARQAGANPGALAVRVLGFSQGAATASRWVARGSVRARDLVLWGGLLPADAGAPGVDAGAALGALRITAVVGNRDEFGTPERLAEQEALLARLGLDYRRRGFAGGHRLDREALAGLAADLRDGRW
jgi:predicted esterase